MELADKTLLRTESYINGKWTGGSTNNTFPVLDPAYNQEIAQVADLTVEDTKKAIEAAYAAFPTWSSKLARERSLILKKWYNLILDNKEDLALLMTTEVGKPLIEARGEVVYGANFVEWFAEEAKRIYGDIIPNHAPGKRLITIKQPIGVVAAITPWNFPLAMITRKIAPALAAGCTVVVKPAEDTPLSALALAELSKRAGFPAGVINVVTTYDAPAVGKELTTNPLVRKVSFTGSTVVGKLLMKQSSGTVKKVSLELGGNAPFIVFEDADLTAAVKGAIASKYRNSGQTCVGANRIMVQDGVYDEFADLYATEVASLKVGVGTESGVHVGPLINDQAISKVNRLVNDAVEKGANALVGGSMHDLGDNFYQPTVLTGVTTEMDIANEEIFGPVAPLYKFGSEDEAIKLANDTPFGLAAYFYARDIGRIWRVAERLEYGMIGINEGVMSTEVAPFGGVKESGLGREGSKYGIDEFTEVKYLCMGGI